jgi:hypothetical protein
MVCEKVFPRGAGCPITTKGDHGNMFTYDDPIIVTIPPTGFWF